MLREVKSKNARAARALAKRAPQVVENPKTTLFLRSTTTSSLINSITTDLYTLKRPLAVRFSKKNTVHPFEDASSLEFFSQKNDTSLICFSSHSKKRPHCITFIRCFEGRVLDMLECMIQENTARPLSQFGGPKCRVGTKPILSFSGSQFEDPDPNSKFVIAKSLFLDFFRGEEAREIDVEGLQMMMTFTAGEDERELSEKQDYVYMRVWRIITKRSGQKLPRVELEEMGPRVDFRLGRVKEPDQSMRKAALKKGKVAEAKSTKNVETDGVGDKIGRLHIGKQDLQDIQTRKMKGLKRSRQQADTIGSDSDNNERIESEISGNVSVKGAMRNRRNENQVEAREIDQSDSDIKRPRLQ